MNKHIKKLVLSSILITIGYLLPLITFQSKSIGTLFLPMHLPVLIAGYILGPVYGLFIGIVLPITRSFIFGLPILYPGATAMAVELAIYGLVSGLLFNLFKKINLKLIINIYLSLIIAMASGRLAYMIFMIIIKIYPFNITVFKLLFVNTILASIPGIIIQLVLIPLLLTILVKTNIYKRINE